MSKDNVIDFHKPETIDDPLTELLRNGAQRLITQAVEAELSELPAAYEGLTDGSGRAAV